MKKLGNIIFWMVFVAIVVWIGTSYVDVIAHQNCGGTDAEWNIFVMLLGMPS